jgi:hypothetical protein
MRLLSFFLLFFIFANTSLAQKRKPYNCTIKVTSTKDYCGGARPSEELLENLRQPKPLPATTFYVIAGLQNKKDVKVIKKVITDSNGKFRLKLRKATYSIISEEQMQPFQTNPSIAYYTWDLSCLRKKWQEPLLKLQIGTTKNATINIHSNCFFNLPCGTFTGALPP